MTKTLLSFLTFLILAPAALPADLSTYRNFQFGTSLANVVKQTGVEIQPKTLHLRPALIQELDWRPRSFGPNREIDAVDGVTFTFYDGTLFRITVLYDRYQTEGMTSDDLVQAISADYGRPVATPAVKAAPESEWSSELPEIVGRWEDSAHAFELTRSSYGPTFKLTGSLKALDAKAAVATAEARRLDAEEAPQREAARRSADDAATQDKLDKARLVNKPKFRP